MLEAESLKISQKRTIKKFLILHFGHEKLESSKKLVMLNSACMPGTECSFINADGHIVKVWCWSLRSMLEFCLRRAEHETWFRVDKIEVCMRENHGKVYCLFTVVALFRHVDDSKKP